MTCILRFDDYSAISNTALERKVLEAVTEANYKIVMAVVPFIAELEWNLRGPIGLLQLPDCKIQLLKEFLPHNVEVALHGYCHQAISRTSGLAEFGDSVPFELQVARLRDAKKWLEDQFAVSVKTFVPPWNAYGRTTLRAVREAGFEALAGDAAFGPLEPGLSYVPGTCSVDQLQGATELAAGNDGAIVCAVLHEFDFSESGVPSSKTSLETFRRACKAGLTGMKCVKVSDCLNEEIGCDRARVNQELRAALQSRRRYLFSRHTGHVYWTSNSASNKLRLLGKSRVHAHA